MKTNITPEDAPFILWGKCALCNRELVVNCKGIFNEQLVSCLEFRRDAYCMTCDEERIQKKIAEVLRRSKMGLNARKVIEEVSQLLTRCSPQRVSRELNRMTHKGKIRIALDQTLKMNTEMLPENRVMDLPTL